MTSSICLDKNYSTTQLLTKETLNLFADRDDKLASSLFLPKGEIRKGEGGLRTQGFFKKSYDNKPLISVVTVVFNGEAYLEETILSVINQTYDNVEYIIIDGGSTDSTLDIIKKYEGQVDYWASEQDSGIYDAMNKAITLATGEWINFMNAGDIFYTLNILNTIFTSTNLHNADILFGHREVRYSDKKRIIKAGKVSSLWKGSQFSHQSAFVSSSFHKEHPFDTNIKITADFSFFYNAYIQKVKYLYLNTIVSSIAAGGLSDTKRIDGILEMWLVIDKNSKVNFYYIFRIIKEMLKEKIKKCFHTINTQKSIPQT